MVVLGTHCIILVSNILHMATPSKKGSTSPKSKGANRVLESAIQREICDYLDSKKYFFWRSNNVPVFAMSNDGVRRFRSLPKFTPKGLPDILLVRYDGVLVGIEVKRPGAKLKPDQANFALKMIKAKAFYHVVRSLDELKERESRDWEIGNTEV